MPTELRSPGLALLLVPTQSPDGPATFLPDDDALPRAARRKAKGEDEEEDDFDDDDDDDEDDFDDE